MTDHVAPSPRVRGPLPAFFRLGTGGDRESLARLALCGLTVTLLAAIMAGLVIGPISLPVIEMLPQVLKHVLQGTVPADDPIAVRNWIVLTEIRMPRVILGALVGAALAVSGAVMQGLFRNPLADPGIIGISAGAGLGAASFIVFGGTVLAPVSVFLGPFALPIAAFTGALFCMLLLYRIGTRQGVTSVATLLLAGIALTALAAASIGLLVYVADNQQLRDINFWNLGSLAGANWDKVLGAGPIILFMLVAVPFLAHGLNALMLGEAAAGHMGIRVQRLKNLAIVAVAAATGAAVAVSGGIGFVGIVVPHLLRLTIGPDHRYLLPASALLGASLLILTDAASRTMVAPAELPIGILTAFAGAPFFLWILLRKRGLTGL
ncbi:iron ABC transporter permease [Roseibium sp. RKSG952]|uniref:FecCD family ABC transporter permease n=1 Tax=Roseibium sp. RKSG952 TaxID=2529384 RepID=UPI0012BB993E|nr:iron ABC transporter permease [Roseibium sp. RKSG952]MTI00181.1 iron ABC transporter permease [Roseibium sp. RKSG952]